MGERQNTALEGRWNQYLTCEGKRKGEKRPVPCGNHPRKIQAGGIN